MAKKSSARKKVVAQATRNKALNINLDTGFYGSFAEIGAGQEVARHFFQAGMASQTVAKSMSAYDKAFSDSIYGKGSRFVSENRVLKMLDHEYSLLEKRLPNLKTERNFFAFANTVATSSYADKPSCHGWMGVRFQSRPNGPINDVVMHIKMLDRQRLQQQEALGVLGVNFLYACHSLTNDGAQFIESLLENLGPHRIEIEYIKFCGKDLNHIDNRLMSLELVKQKITKAVMFNPEGEPLCPSDALYGKKPLVQRGTFRPVTNINLEISNLGQSQFLKDIKAKKSQGLPIMEITMSRLKKSGRIDDQDFLNRVDTLGATGQHVMVSQFDLYSEMSEYLIDHTCEEFALVIGAGALPLIFDEKYYSEDSQSMLKSFSYLFAERSRLYVYPFKDENSCMTSKSFTPKGNLAQLYRYFINSGKIIDLADCDDLDTSMQAKTVRQLLISNNKEWEKLVPPSVKKLIQKKKMFQ